MVNLYTTSFNSKFISFWFNFVIILLNKKFYLIPILPVIVLAKSFSKKCKWTFKLFWKLRTYSIILAVLAAYI